MGVFLRVIVIFVILIFSFGASAQIASFETHPDGKNLPFKSVAIGIASPGPGVSKLGHAFLIFMTKKERLSESYAIQFNVSDLPSGQTSTPEPLGFFGFGKRFSTQAVAGLKMINTYRVDNRAVLLFILKMTPRQLSSLWVNLRQEHLRREESVQTDYNFLYRNCLTESLRYLNQVLDPAQKKFVYFDSDNTFKSFVGKYLGLAGLYIQNAPYAVAPDIARHPLVIGKPLVLTPVLIANARLLVSLEKNTLLFLEECHADRNLHESTSRINAQPTLRESQAYLNLLERIKQKCQSPKGIEAYHQVIEGLYSLAEPTESLLRIERYLL